MPESRTLRSQDTSAPQNWCRSLIQITGGAAVSHRNCPGSKCSDFSSITALVEVSRTTFLASKCLEIGAEVSQSVLMPKCLVAEVSSNRMPPPFARKVLFPLSIFYSTMTLNSDLLTRKSEAFINVPTTEMFLLYFIYCPYNLFLSIASSLLFPRFVRATAYAIARICHANSVCPSVCLSVTRVYCIKTSERIIEILLPSHRPIILVFGHQGSLRKSGGVTPTGAPNTRGVAIFDQYAAISRK